MLVVPSNRQKEQLRSGIDSGDEREEDWMYWRWHADAQRCEHAHHVCSVWEMPLFLTQIQQGIKSTLCVRVMERFACLDSNLDRVPPLKPIMFMSPSCETWSSWHHPFIYKSTERAPSAPHGFPTVSQTFGPLKKTVYLWSNLSSLRNRWLFLFTLFKKNVKWIMKAKYLWTTTIDMNKESQNIKWRVTKLEWFVLIVKGNINSFWQGKCKKMRILPSWSEPYCLVETGLICVALLLRCMINGLFH